MVVILSLRMEANLMQLLRGNRRGEARSALREVQARHNEIQKIEKTIIELAQLFQEMDQLVTEQEPMVENIDQRGEEIVQNVDKAQEEIGQAVEKARSRRRKKWWCLLIVRKYTFSILLFTPSFTEFGLSCGNSSRLLARTRVVAERPRYLLHLESLS